MPKMGESIAEATILKWLKKEGDSVELDEAILEIATDKVDSEVPSPVAGKITKIMFAEGDVVEVGKAIAIIETAGENAGSTAKAEDKPAAPAKEEAPAQGSNAQAQSGKPESNKPTGGGNGARFYSPLVLNIAREEGISMSELEALPGTGAEGRVTKKDILAYAKNRTAEGSAAAPQSTPAAETRHEGAATQPKQESKPAAAAPQVNAGAGDEIVEMDRMRKLIADHMVMSMQTSPHVTSFVEADVTNIVMWRDRIKKEFEKREGEKITFTPIFIEAVAKAIKDFPGINVSVSGNSIIRRKNVNIGMAAALPSGNLIVPVIKNADTKNLLGLTKDVNDLANRARANQLKPEDIQGGTFTLTNVGSFGNLMGTPIINQPQVAIMAVGAIKKKPVVIESPQGDMIGIRHMMFLSLSYDHRVVDGMLGGSFLRRVADYLEQFDPKRNI